MKMEIVCLLLGLAFVGLVSGDTTFFEGSFDEGYIVVGENNLNVDEVFCGNAVCDVEEDCFDCMRDCGVCVEEVVEEDSRLGITGGVVNEIVRGARSNYVVIFAFVAIGLIVYFLFRRKRR